MEIDTDINSYSFNDLKTFLNINSEKIEREELEKKCKIKKKEIENLEDDKLGETINEFIDRISEYLEWFIEDKGKEKESEERERFLERDEMKKINNKMDYLINFNFENSKKLESIYSVDPINQSNIALNPRTYNVIKKQVAINSEFRNKSLISQESRLLRERQARCCDDKTEKYNKEESSSNFTIELSEPMDNVIGLELVSTEIPIVFNTFSIEKNNSKFILSVKARLEVLGPPPPINWESYHIEIPDGIWLAKDLEDFLSNNYFDKDIIDSGGIIQNSYLRYLKFEINSYSGRVVIRFKTQAEREEYNTVTGTSFRLVELDTDPDVSNFTYKLENGKEELDCSNRMIFVQGFREIDTNIDDNEFKFTTLGTLGYLEGQIYKKIHISINKIVLEPIEIKYSNINYERKIGLILFNGYLEAGNIYGSTVDSAVYIRVNDFVGNRGEQILLVGRDKSLITNNILSRIAFKIGVFQNNIFNSLQDYNIKRKYFGGVRINKLQIQVVDKFGRIVNLQNYPTNFVFEFTIEYSSERLANFRNEM